MSMPLKLWCCHPSIVALLVFSVSHCESALSDMLLKDSVRIGTCNQRLTALCGGAESCASIYRMTHFLSLLLFSRYRLSCPRS